jgi:lysine-specific histone demethylase 1
VRGKKNLVFDKSLVGPVGTIVKVNTLQEYGVDKFFILENDNVDTSQHNVVFIARGECGRHAEKIASMSAASPFTSSSLVPVYAGFT